MAKNERARPAACLSADGAGALGHRLTNVRGAPAFFPDISLVEELAGGRVEGRRAGPGGKADRKGKIEIVENPEK